MTVQVDPFVTCSASARDVAFYERLARARATDPATSHEAAAAVKPAESEMQRAIRIVVHAIGSGSAEEIAGKVVRGWPGRWIESTIVSACSPKRSGLKVVGHRTNSRGRRVRLLSLP